jgi:eukaryotic-like serine/threonine-protein kinase
MAPARIGEVSVALLQSAQANALHDLGEHTPALALAQAAADTFRQFLGPDNYLTLTQLSSVAGIHQACATVHPPFAWPATCVNAWSRTFGDTMQASLLATGRLGLAEHRCGDASAGRDYLGRPRARCSCISADHPAAKAFSRRLLEAT